MTWTGWSGCLGNSLRGPLSAFLGSSSQSGANEGLPRRSSTCIPLTGDWFPEVTGMHRRAAALIPSECCGDGMIRGMQVGSSTAPAIIPSWCHPEA